jgi:hypothetical protein
MHRTSLKIAILATLATLVPAASAIAGWKW